jgi:hypothetical protein
MRQPARKIPNPLIEPRSILFGLAVFNFVLVFVEARNHAMSGIVGVVSPWYHPWSYSNEPTRVLLAATCLWIGKLWSNIVALLLAGYMVAHFVYLVSFSSVTFAQEWKYLRQFEPYLVGSFDSQYVLALILFSFAVYYSLRRMSQREDVP